MQLQVQQKACTSKLKHNTTLYIRTCIKIVQWHVPDVHMSKKRLPIFYNTQHALSFMTYIK